MNKHTRQAAILEAISREHVGTQNDLVKALKKKGIEATQVSISRDIAELGLIKVGGVYRAGSAETGAADPELPLRSFLRRVHAAGPNLTVIRCDPGAAPKVAFALDNLTVPGLVGTLAGDDTVFVAVDSASSQKKLIDFLNARMNTQ
mgnify:CR=1 FL=1